MERRPKEADGRRAARRDRRLRNVVLVALQNVLVATCLLLTVYCYFKVSGGVEGQNYEENVHIRFMTIGDISSNGTLQFGYVNSCYKMNLVKETTDKINIHCTGPYVFYMYVCYNSLRAHETSGYLQLRVKETPVISINLSTTHEVCRGLHHIAYLRARQNASLYLHVTDGFKVKNLTVGLNYLLGRQCDY